MVAGPRLCSNAACCFVLFSNARGLPGCCSRRRAAFFCRPRWRKMIWRRPTRFRSRRPSSSRSRATGICSRRRAAWTWRRRNCSWRRKFPTPLFPIRPRESAPMKTARPWETDFGAAITTQFSPSTSSSKSAASGVTGKFPRKPASPARAPDFTTRTACSIKA